MKKKIKETIVKSHKTKSCFFEKINKINKPLARLIKKKEDSDKNKREETKIDITEIQRIRREDYAVY